MVSPFYLWFTTFLEEKEVDLSLPLNDHVQVGDVCQFICETTPDEQAKIKMTLVKIDFYNGDVYHFFGHLAKALTPEAVEQMKNRMTSL